MKMVNIRNNKINIVKMLLCALVCFAAAVYTCTAEKNKITGVKSSKDGIVLNLEQSTITVKFIKNNIIQVKHHPSNEISPATPVLSNFAVENIVYKKNETEKEIIVTTPEMTVKINKNPYGMAFYKTDGTLLLGESNNTVFDGSVISFNHDPRDHFYGINSYNADEDSSKLLLRDEGGEVKAGYQGYAGAPFIWSTSGYGLLVDTDGCGFIVDKTSIDCASTSRSDLDYFVISGRPTDIMKGLNFLSGPAPMLPKWSLGFMNSEWGTDEDELAAIIKKYRSKSIPLDAYILDFDWKAWGEDEYGEWRWNPDRYPSGPNGLLKKQMDGFGVKLVGIMKPRVHVGTVQGKYASDHGYFIPGKKQYNDYFSTQIVKDIDFSNAEAARWFWSNSEKAFSMGIAAVWNDEADVGFDNFGHFNMAKTYYEYARGKADKRTFSLNRNFYLGAQRYASVLWSGDIRSGFRVMAAQRERMLSAVNVGQMKWSMDIGGFNSEPSSENYARWMQFGAFVPVFRVHAQQDQQRQPWAFGDKAEKVALAAIKLRYALQPYIYSYERSAYENGIGVVRPLLYEYPHDAKLANYVDAWFFGEYLVAAPVMTDGDKVKEIYLPEGTWTDYFTGEKYAGGKIIKHAVDVKNWSDIPLFVKDGAIIPTQEVLNYTGEKKIETITLDIFPSSNGSSFSYYEDDGNTYGYEKGIFFRQIITCRKIRDSSVSLTLGQKEGTYAASVNKYVVKIHGFRGSAVSINNKHMKIAGGVSAVQVGSAYNSKDRYGEVTVVCVAAGVPLNIEVIR